MRLLLKTFVLVVLLASGASAQSVNLSVPTDEIQVGDTMPITAEARNACGDVVFVPVSWIPMRGYDSCVVVTPPLRCLACPPPATPAMLVTGVTAGECGVRAFAVIDNHLVFSPSISIMVRQPAVYSARTQLHFW